MTSATWSQTPITLAADASEPNLNEDEILDQLCDDPCLKPSVFTPTIRTALIFTTVSFAGSLALFLF
jgi:hypothetical protein